MYAKVFSFKKSVRSGNAKLNDERIFAALQRLDAGTAPSAQTILITRNKCDNVFTNRLIDEVSIRKLETSSSP